MGSARRLWRDECGETNVMSLILVATIIGLGATVGLTTFRNQLVQEFGDAAVSLENLDQSFSAPCYGTYVDVVTETDTPNQPPDSLAFIDP